MLIERHEFLDPEGAKPIISGVTAFGNLVLLKGVAADPADDISVQTRQVLRQIDDLLALAGTDKTNILSAPYGLRTCECSVSTTSPGMSGWTLPIHRCEPVWKPDCSRRGCWSKSWSSRPDRMAMAGAEGSEEAETRLFGVIAGQHSRSSMAITSG